jgi:hypothetical protein
MSVDEIAAPSTAPVQSDQAAAPEPINVETFTREQRAEWFKEGKLPSKKAESTPAGETSESPAEDKPAQGKKDPETSFRELREKSRLAEERASRLEAELAELKKGAKQAPPAEVKQEKPKADERPKRLSMEEFILANPTKDWKAYEDYKDEYAEQLADWKVKQTLEAREKQQSVSKQQEAITATIRDRVERAKKDTTMPDFLAIVTNDHLTEVMQKSGVMDPFLVERDRDGKIQYYLGKNLDEAARIAEMTPIGQARALGKLEDKFYPEEPAAPVQKKTSAASPPPATVSGNAHMVDDEAKAALAANDFRRFKMLEDAKDIARAKGR